MQNRDWLLRIGSRVSSSTLMPVVVLVLAIVATRSARAQTFTLLHTFGGEPDGANPGAGLVSDAKGNLYGTTYFGGSSNFGTVFKVDTNGTETVLYSFCAKAGCADGSNPNGGLAIDVLGNLYGVTNDGGSSDYYGTVFRVSRKGKETVLYSFCPDGGACTDGAFPHGNLVMDAAGDLYGITSNGGTTKHCPKPCGTVFEVTKAGKETVLHSFIGGADGAFPAAGLVVDPRGNLYGTTTAGGGRTHDGTVFKLSRRGKEIVLYRFTGGSDGAIPGATLILDAKGNLYGTTSSGGGSSNVGTVFRVSKTGKETVLYRFTGSTDGAFPESGLVMDAKGNLYGTASEGGGSGDGTVFRLTQTGRLAVLHTFTGGTDGALPYGNLLMGADGALYGTASGGGASGNGTVWKLTP
jgi:uncharacterized repeat protein (TIGR03803 family)